MDQASSISAGALKTFVHRCGTVAGLSPEDASRLVDGVVEADLRGVASHGISRLPTYLRALARGVVNPRPAVQVLRSKGAVEVLDADNGLGVIVGQQAMERAVNLAREFGVGTVSVRNSNHSGMLAAHVLKAPPHGAVGFFTSNGPAIMAPFGGREPRLGNGPVALRHPSASERAARFGHGVLRNQPGPHPAFRRSGRDAPARLGTGRDRPTYAGRQRRFAWCCVARRRPPGFRVGGRQ